MGAWIETCLMSLQKTKRPVAPHVGAWIETLSAASNLQYQESRPTWARGLKHSHALFEPQNVESRPTWARGLKLLFVNLYLLHIVAPHVGAWIETYKIPLPLEPISPSRPTWARGLKHGHLLSVNL